MSKEKIDNPHYVRIESGIATEAQIRGSILSALTATDIKIKREKGLGLGVGVNKNYGFNSMIDEKDMIINVMTRNGKPSGYSYVWFSNIEICYLLLGLNGDGSQRVIYKDDPHWVCPPPIVEPTLDEALQQSKGKSWADIADRRKRSSWRCISVLRYCYSAGSDGSSQLHH